MQTLLSKTGVCIALLFIMVGLSGCNIHGDDRQMLKYMEKKYQEKFDFEGSCYGQFGNSYRMIYVKNSKWNHILVRTIYNGQEPCFQDNYPGYLQQEEIQMLLQPVIHDIFGECKVFYQVPESVFPEDMNIASTAQDILQNANCMNIIYIYLPHTTKDMVKKLEQLRLTLKSRKYCLTGVLSCPTEYSWYEKISQDMVGKERYCGYEAKEEVVFHINNKGEYRVFNRIISGGGN